MTATDKLIPLLVVGTGHGCRVHVPAAREAGFQVVGLVGTDPERTRRRADKAGVPGAYTDLETAIAKTGARAVSVASPPHSHGEAVFTAVARHCHVLCEKPFARDMGEARAMAHAANEVGVVNLLGNQMRALPERIVAARAIAEGVIGAPKLVTMIQQAGLVNAGLKWPDWWLDKNAGGGWLGASGSHMIDQVHSWLGPIQSLSGCLSVASGRDGLADDSFTIRFLLENGAEGVMQQTGASFGPTASMTRVVGTAGTLWLENGAAWVADRDGHRQLESPPELALRAMAPSEDPRKQFLHVELPPAIRLFGAFRQGILGDREAVRGFASFADGVAAMEVIDAVRRSDAEGGALVRLR